jgi:2-dehydro-3-deoxyphosphogluconate aldolase/(4S)-4-hydroxy-2-oxoglutarate aldolase
VATGGVTLQAAGDFIKAGAAAVGVGSELVAGGTPERIAQAAQAYVEAVRVARM